MKRAVVTVILLLLFLAAPVQANVAGNTKRQQILYWGSGGAHTAIAVWSCSTCGCVPTYSCVPQTIATAWQAVEDFIGSDNGQATCDQASQGSGNCPNLPPNPNFPPIPPPYTPPPYAGPPTGTTTGGVPIPTGTKYTPPVTALPKPPILPSQKLPEILAKRPELKNLLNQLAKKGITMDFDKGVINTPIGPLSPGSLNDPATMAALGGTAAGAKLVDDFAKKEIEKMKKDVEKKLNALDSEGGGGGGGVLTATPEEDDELKNYMKRMMARMPAQEKNNINGLSKLVNGEPIGIAAGNIFKTIEMRYDKLEQSGIFIVPVK
jgi:hypothetical protein